MKEVKKMDNNRYTAPELEIIAFDSEDVIMTSGFPSSLEDPDMGKWLS